MYASEVIRLTVLVAIVALPLGAPVYAAGSAAGEVPDSEALVACTDEAEWEPVQLLQHDLHLNKGLALEMALEQASASLEKQVQSWAASKEQATSTTTLPPTGLTANAVGDLKVFITSAILYYGFCIFCIFFFSFMRLRYPIMYSANVIDGLIPAQPIQTFFGWFAPTMSLTIDEIAEHITLDHAMLIEFTHVAMKMMAVIGVPMIVVEGSLNWACGGLAAGEDHLSYLSFGNVKNGVWLYWFHSFVIWYVVVYSTWAVHHAMRDFMPRRFEWLRAMPDIRANTVLVEGVPEECRNEQSIRDLFGELLPGAEMSRVEFVKDTWLLEMTVSQRENALYRLHAAEAQVTKDPTNKPTLRESMFGAKVEAIPYWKKQAEELEPQVKRERQRISVESKMNAGVNLSCVFVTFKQRTSAELALHLSSCVTNDQDEWVMLTAPDPSDVLWADLTQDETAREARTVIGYLLVIVLYFLYMPIVILVTNLGKMIKLKWIGLGSLQSAWDGVAPTLGLQFILAFLPTFLILIFKAFFTCRSEAFQQHKLQIWYFWFQFVFVLLATAIGQNFMGFAKTLVSDPMNLIPVLASAMPNATHYYMNWLVLQCFSHGMNLTRYIPFIKFKMALSVFDEKDAKVLAEPEDQDFYGMGSRSAQWTTVLGVGIVFGTLSPPICILTFIAFFVSRVIYGYLVVFAETRKSDTGGFFFVTSLEQVFPLLILYVILMAGVLYDRAASVGPCIIAAVSLLWIFASLNKFKHYTWESLPMQEMHSAKDFKKRPDKGQYVQPELIDASR